MTKQNIGKSQRRPSAATLSLLFLFVGLGLFVCSPQSAAGKNGGTSERPGGSPISATALAATDNAEKKDDIIFEVEQNWNVSSIYDLDEAAAKGTESFSKEEIARARELVVERLQRENLGTLPYDAYLLDKQGAGVMPVYVIFADAVRYVDGKSINRTYFVSGHKIIKEIVSNRPPSGNGANQLTVSMNIRAATHKRRYFQ